MLDNAFWRLGGSKTTLLGIVVCVCTSCLMGAESVPTEADLRARLLEARSGPEKGFAAQRLFTRASPQDLQRLCFDEDDAVAICAAWRRLEIQTAGRLLGTDRAADVIPIPAELSREFLGFIEGRLRLPAPDDWTQNLLSSRYSRWGVTLFFVEEYSTAHDISGAPLEGIGLGRSSLPRVSLTLDVDGVAPYATFIGREMYEGQDATCHLPMEIVTLLKRQHDLTGVLSVRGLASDGRAIIALPGDGAGSEELICMGTSRNSSSAKVLWRCRMDTHWVDDFKGWRWFTEFRLKGTMLYLFHCTPSSIGVECVSLADGSRRFSFNSRWPSPQ